jgi:hypothetical protein
MKIDTVRENHKRQWVRCRTCGAVAYYDYVPYSLSNPLSWLPCHHGVGERDMGADRITADEALCAVSISSPARNTEGE